MKREQVRDEVVKAVAGTQSLTESIDAIMEGMGTHGVIESRFAYSTWRPLWFQGSHDECLQALDILSREDPRTFYEIIPLEK